MNNRFKDCLLTSERSELLAILSRAIGELTLCGRDCYGSPDEAAGLTRTNEAIHRVVGHLRDLTDLAEPMTTSRANGVMEALQLVSPRGLDRIVPRAA